MIRNAASKQQHTTRLLRSPGMALRTVRGRGSSTLPRRDCPELPQLPLRRPSMRARDIVRRWRCQLVQYDRPPYLISAASLVPAKATAQLFHVALAAIPVRSPALDWARLCDPSSPNSRAYTRYPDPSKKLKPCSTDPFTKDGVHKWCAASDRYVECQTCCHMDIPE
ncbi:hypothetical protein EDD37DRAFT_622861 [Exophiala viscosa]|uniref:Uncharacterized protein n=1 Tax=Exophiala viscosa TaxID=2486360 RepID=A0AAN6E6Q8_9EURO|nr:hypothetical protein EDD36DRAFT_33008 [Exophiala viscosa]KAI1627625.1 hypothetical protein EDD37DRAFT_622861 [Exophiala viscosa]